jgi:hypothetical protein
MGVCTYCYQKKPVFAPVCHHCNNAAGLIERVVANVIFSVTPFIVFVWFFYWLLS